MKPHINLLPPWARRAKARKKLLIILAVVQAAVFLVLASGFVITNALERRVWARSYELTQALAAFSPEQGQLAEEVQNARDAIFYIDEIFAEDGLYIFDYARLQFVLESVPTGAALNRVYYSGGGFLLIGTTTDINIIGAHLKNLAENFHYVQHGRINRGDYGSYAYEIRIRFAEAPRNRGAD